MNRHLTVAAGLSLLLATGCSNPLVAVAVSKLVGPGSTWSAKPQAGAPEILVTLTGRGVRFKMFVLEKDGPVTIWAAQDGTQIFLRDGFLIGTRGFGRDLMSADAPSMAQLRAMKPHTRHYFDLDGSDTTIRFDFACAVIVGENSANLPGTKHLVEACVHPDGTLQNEFWLNSSGTAQKSSQWVSTGVGYAIIEQQ